MYPKVGFTKEMSTITKMAIASMPRTKKGKDVDDMNFLNIFGFPLASELLRLALRLWRSALLRKTSQKNIEEIKINFTINI